MNRPSPIRRLLKLRRRITYQLVNASDSHVDSDMYTFELLKPSDATRLDRLRHDAIVRKYSRYAEGVVGVIAIGPGGPVGHAWSTAAWNSKSHLWRPVLNGYFRARQDSALIHDCYVDPAHRGRGVFGAMITLLSSVLTQARPSALVFIDADESNVHSQRGIIRAGFSELGVATYVYVGRVVVGRRQPRPIDSEGY